MYFLLVEFGAQNKTSKKLPKSSLCQNFVGQQAIPTRVTEMWRRLALHIFITGVLDVVNFDPDPTVHTVREVSHSQRGNEKPVFPRHKGSGQSQTPSNPES